MDTRRAFVSQGLLPLRVATSLLDLLDTVYIIHLSQRSCNQDLIAQFNSVDKVEVSNLPRLIGLGLTIRVPI